MFLRNMNFHRAIRRYTPNDRILYNHSCDNFKSHVIIFILTNTSILFYPILLYLLRRKPAYEIMILCECCLLILNQSTDFHEFTCVRCNTGGNPNFVIINFLPPITKWHTNFLNERAITAIWYRTLTLCMVIEL